MTLTELPVPEATPQPASPTSPTMVASSAWLAGWRRRALAHGRRPEVLGGGHDVHAREHHAARLEGRHADRDDRLFSDRQRQARRARDLDGRHGLARAAGPDARRCIAVRHVVRRPDIRRRRVSRRVATRPACSNIHGSGPRAVGRRARHDRRTPTGARPGPSRTTATSRPDSSTTRRRRHALGRALGRRRRRNGSSTPTASTSARRSAAITIAQSSSALAATPTRRSHGAGPKRTASNILDAVADGDPGATYYAFESSDDGTDDRRQLLHDRSAARRSQPRLHLDAGRPHAGIPAFLALYGIDYGDDFSDLVVNSITRMEKRC